MDNDTITTPSPDPPAPPATLTGRTFGDLEIRELLGKGAFADVYLGFDRQMQRLVALKFPTRGHILEEAKTLAGFSHPNVLTVHAITTIEGRECLIMEYASRGSLDAYLKQQRLSPIEVLEIAVDVVSGVLAAHEHHVIHRDLKPQNILRTAAGQWKVADFGLALQLPSPVEGIAGTPGFIPPEVLAGQPPDHRSDQWSLGAVLYLLATGEHPFPSGATSSPAACHELRPEIPSRFGNVVQQMLAPNPALRFGSVRDVLDELARLYTDLRQSRSQRLPLLAVFTVGGAIPPVVKTIQDLRPSRVIFIVSNTSKRDALDKPGDGILAKLAIEAITLDYLLIYISNENDPRATLEDTYRQLVPLVDQWIQLHPTHKLVMDYTAGTKPMSAALALVARRWPCDFAYVGSAPQARTWSLGYTTDRGMRYYNTENPWNTLGYEAAEHAIEYFNQGAYGIAASLLDDAVRKATDPKVKRPLMSLAHLSHAYAAWERFELGAADSRLADCMKSLSELAAFGFDYRHERDLRTELQTHREWLAKLRSSDYATIEWLADLLADADRRLAERRFDDAVARLYRFIEALAQYQLRAAHNIPNTGSVDPAALPENLRKEWEGRLEAGSLKLALQDSYRLLAAKQDPLGDKFRELQLDRRESPLSARNNSRFAHQFQPVGEAAAASLRKAAHALGELLGIRPDTLPRFPKLPRPGSLTR